MVYLDVYVFVKSVVKDTFDSAVNIYTHVHVNQSECYQTLCSSYIKYDMKALTSQNCAHHKESPDFTKFVNIYSFHVGLGLYYMKIVGIRMYIYYIIMKTPTVYSRYNA